MNTRRQTGYTLIELLLYVGIVGMLLSAVATFFVTTASARIKNQSISEVDSQGAFALDYIAQTIRNASSISAPAAGATASQLTLVVPTGSLSPTIFSLNGGVLQVKEGAATAVPLTNSKVQVTNLTVKNLSRSGTAGVVQVSLTLSRINNGSRYEFDYQETFTTSAGVRP